MEVTLYFNIDGKNHFKVTRGLNKYGQSFFKVFSINGDLENELTKSSVYETASFPFLIEMPEKSAEENEVSIFGLDRNVKNRISLIPLGEDVRGEGVEVELDSYGGDDNGNETEVLNIPKAPNTGKK